MPTLPPPDTSPPRQPARPLLVTEDPELLDDLLRLATAADVAVTVAHTVAHATREWPRAPLVVLGTDLAPAVAEVEPARHGNVVLADRHTASALDEAALWRDAARVGARQLLALPADETQLVDLFAEAADGPPSAPSIVGVIGGCGGAGASVLAVALALAGVRARQRTMLIDADPLGAGVDLVLAREHAPGARWGDLVDRRGRISRAALWEALPAAHGMALLTWGHDTAERVPVAAMRAVLTSAARGTDLLVLDLPRAVDPAGEEALRRASLVLILVPARVHAVVAATRVAATLRDRTANLRAVIRAAPRAGLSAEVVATSLGLPLAGELASEPGLDRSLERGDVPATRPRSPLARFGDTLVARLRDLASGTTE